MPAGTRSPIGVHVGNPNGNGNGNGTAAEAAFAVDFTSFVSVMGGARPATMNAFTGLGQGLAPNAAVTAKVRR